jgi:thiamine-phosphate pyrophosphorylase
MGSNFLTALAGAHLYPITDQHLSGISHEEQVLLLSDRGARLVQLREKVDSPLRFFAQVEAALRVARNRGVKIIINDRVDIALALDADGVHLGQDDLPPEAARRILGSEAIIGFSTHNRTQAILAAQMKLDYIAIGPIFSTNTKESKNPPLGLEELARIKQITGAIPLVAIGGITNNNKTSVLDAGADVVAVIRELWLPAGDANNSTKHVLNVP